MKSKVIRTILSSLLIVVMLFTAVPITASAATWGYCGENLSWSFNESTGKLTISGTGDMDDWGSDGNPEWALYRDEIKTVLIDNGVTSIGSEAFEYCVNLTSVAIPLGVTAIGSYAFDCCYSLTSITIPNTVTSIGSRAFGFCESLFPIIPDSVTTIGSGAFWGCEKFSNIEISENVVSMDGAFSNCKGLTKITVDADNQYYSNDSYGVLYNKDKTELIQYPIGNTRTDYNIPNSVEYISGYAFYYSNLANVYIPDSVYSISDHAFENCTSLTNITIPGSVWSIEDYAFAWCDGLKSVKISEGVKRIGYAAFQCCENITSVTIPNSVTFIDDIAFDGCSSLTEIIMPVSASLSSLGLGGEIYGIFSSCPNVKKITLTKGAGKMPDFSSDYYGGNKSYRYTPWYLTRCNTIVIENDIENIGKSSFYYCTKLTEIYIPDSVYVIGDNAFYGCSGLIDVYYSGTQKKWNELSIGSGNENLLNANIHFLSEPETPTYTITYNANGGSNAPASQTKTENVSITLSKSTPTRSGYTFLGWSTNKNATVAQYKPGATFSANANTTLYAVWSKEKKYNLGEETYSFDNFVDSDSPGGHCFGMSMTSAGYYLNELDIKDIGLNSSSELYTASETAKVKKPICHYQDIQGTYSRDAIVAGGTSYKYGYYNISSDWNAVVNYVKNHNYDDTGALQIGLRKSSQGGHAVNFLRYENVNGEDRIYAYDNNFPNTETYFYKGSDGKVYQKPYSTFSGAIDCIALRSVAKYFDLAGDFDSSRVIYGWADTIEVEGVTGYPMDLGGSGEYMMYEIPDGVDEVVIVPLTDNATFEYMNEDYQFGGINEETYGVFTLSTSESSNDESFVIENEQSSVDEVFVYDLDMTYKSYAWIETEIYVTGNIDYTVEYSSSNPSVAYVDEFGEVYAAGEGSAEITCTVTDEYGNVVTDTCEVKVSYAWWQWIIRILLLGFLWY